MTNLHKQAVVPSLESYRFIPLTREQFALVDIADFDWLNQWKWMAKASSDGNGFYAVRAIYIKGKQRIIGMHNLVLGVDRGAEHINGAKLDNRRQNLRKATHRQNCLNRKVRSDSRSGVTGVAPKGRVKGDGWKAHITIDGEWKLLGVFDTKQEAVVVRKAAEKRYYGEFARE